MSDKKLFIKAIMFAATCSLLITIILTCVLSVVMLSTGLLPDYILDFATIALLAAGTFFGGFISARITKSAGLITGLITGFVVFFLITVIGVAKSNDSFSELTLIRLGATLISGAIGGIIGVNKKEKINIK